MKFRALCRDPQCLQKNFSNFQIIANYSTVYPESPKSIICNHFFDCFFSHINFRASRLLENQGEQPHSYNSNARKLKGENLMPPNKKNGKLKVR